MILYVTDVTKPAIICELVYDSNTGEGRVMIGEDLELPKGARIQCTTLEEFSILKHLGYNVHMNEHPSEATINGVKVEGAPPAGPSVE